MEFENEEPRTAIELLSVKSYSSARQSDKTRILLSFFRLNGFEIIASKGCLFKFLLKNIYFGQMWFQNAWLAIAL